MDDSPTQSHHFEAQHKMVGHHIDDEYSDEPDRFWVAYGLGVVAVLICAGMTLYLMP